MAVPPEETDWEGHYEEQAWDDVSGEALKSKKSQGSTVAGDGILQKDEGFYQSAGRRVQKGYRQRSVENEMD